MKRYKGLIINVSLSAVIGIIIGVTAGIFGRLLHFAEHLRSEHYMFFLPFLGIAGVIILYLYKHISPNSEQGLNLAIAYNAGRVNKSGEITKGDYNGKYPKAYGFLKLFTNFIMLLFGASTGKEGSFAAYGASMGDYVSRMFRSRSYRRTYLLSGIAAAVSGLFQTPIGGVFFALEFTSAGIMSYYALLPATIASFSAYYASKLCGFNAFSHIITEVPKFGFTTILLVIFCGVIFGIVGRSFSTVLHNMHKLYKKHIKNRYLCILICGSVIAGILILSHSGRYGGSGDIMLTSLFTTGNFKIYDFILKFIFTIACITIGFSGGEMMPLLSIGAALGATVSLITGLPLEVCAAMGCVAVYGSATNTLIAPIFIGIELFGTEMCLYIALACMVAYAINGNKSVYSRQGHITPEIHEFLQNTNKR